MPFQTNTTSPGVVRTIRVRYVLPSYHAIGVFPPIQ